MNYLVIDLEMCNVPKQYRGRNYRYKNETIQIGAVLLDENYQQIASMSQYVHPVYGVLDHYITELTGITGSNVKNAPLLEEVLRHMIEWLGDREYRVMAWSTSDIHQLTHEIVSKNITDAAITDFIDPDRWIDYQEVFGTRFEFERAIGLSEALMLSGIEPDGRFHDGLCDAVNTAKLIEKLELHPEFTVKNYEKEIAKASEPLNFSLGDLFKNISLNIPA